jgi:hypothetical protein
MKRINLHGRDGLRVEKRIRFKVVHSFHREWVTALPRIRRLQRIRTGCNVFAVDASPEQIANVYLHRVSESSQHGESRVFRLLDKLPS